MQSAGGRGAAVRRVRSRHMPHLQLAPPPPPQVIAAERRGDYLGKTVQVIPHVTDCIQDWLERVSGIAVDAGPAEGGGSFDDSAAEAAAPDICLVEVS